jgi:hypothetical protein
MARLLLACSGTLTLVGISYARLDSDPSLLVEREIALVDELTPAVAMLVISPPTLSRFVAEETAIGFAAYQCPA